MKYLVAVLLSVFCVHASAACGVVVGGADIMKDISAGFSLLVVYNPHNTQAQSHINTAIDVANRGRSRESNCIKVVIADGVSFTPHTERVFTILKPFARSEKDTTSPIDSLRRLGIINAPEFLIVQDGLVVQKLSTETPPSAIDAHIRALLDTQSDALQAASSPGALIDSIATEPLPLLIVQQNVTIALSARSLLYRIGVSVYRVQKQSAAHAVLFSSGTPRTILVTPDTSVTASRLDLPPTWARRLKEGHRIMVPIPAKSDVIAGSDIAGTIINVAFNNVAPGKSNIGTLTASRAAAECLVVLFLKEATLDEVAMYENRLKKIASRDEWAGHRKPCSFLIADPDEQPNLFASFGFQHNVFYIPNGGAATPSTETTVNHVVRRRFSDHVIGVEYNNRRFQYNEAVFSVPLVKRFIDKVLLNKVVRVYVSEQWMGSKDYCWNYNNATVVPFSNIFDLYHEALRDFQRDSVVLFAPGYVRDLCIHSSTSLRWDHTCGGNATVAAKYGHAIFTMGEMVARLRPGAHDAIRIFIMATDRNEWPRFLGDPPTPNHQAFLRIFDRTDKLEYFTKHQHYFHSSSNDELPAYTISVDTSLSLSRLIVFLRECSERLNSYLPESEFDDEL